MRTRQEHRDSTTTTLSTSASRREHEASAHPWQERRVRTDLFIFLSLNHKRRTHLHSSTTTTTPPSMAAVPIRPPSAAADSETASPIPDSDGTRCGTLGAHCSNRDGAHGDRSSSTRDSRFFPALGDYRTTSLLQRCLRHHPRWPRWSPHHRHRRPHPHHQRRQWRWAPPAAAPAAQDPPKR